MIKIKTWPYLSHKHAFFAYSRDYLSSLTLDGVFFLANLLISEKSWRKSRKMKICKINYCSIALILWVSLIGLARWKYKTKNKTDKLQRHILTIESAQLPIKSYIYPGYNISNVSMPKHVLEKHIFTQIPFLVKNYCWKLSYDVYSLNFY